MSSSELHYVKPISSLSETSHEIAERIIRMLKEAGETLGVAESLTGGSIMAALASVEGASAVFRGGVVTYATPLKHSLLGVDAELIIDHGVIDSEVARQMALGVRNRTAVHGVQTTWGISTTRVAGPDPQDDKPVGTVFIGIASAQHCQAFGPYHFFGDRSHIREATVVEALARIYQMLVGRSHLVLVREEQTVINLQTTPGE